MFNSFIKTQLLSSKKDLLLGHIIFIALIIFSIVFVYERVFYMDSAYQLFEMIKQGGFHQNVRRYSMYFAELLPLLAIKLNLPLKTVILSYSLSFTLIGYGFWLLTTYVLKNRYVGIIMLLIMIGMKHTFFHTISETFQLMFFGAFLYAWITSRFAEKKEMKYKILYYSIALLMMTLCMFIHPVALFFLIFIAGVFILNNKFSNQEKTIITILMLGIISLKYFTIEQGSHDTDYNMELREFLGHCINIYRISSTKWFVLHFIEFYWAPALLLVVALVHYIRNKQYRNLCFYFGFTFFFMIITLVLYYNPDSEIGRERSFLPLVFFCGLPFMKDIFPKLSLKWSNVFFIGLTLLIGIGFVKIAAAGTSYSERLKKIDEIVAFANKTGQKKLVMDKELSHTIFPFYNWATGFESMMYSAVLSPDSTVNFYIEEELNTQRDNPKFLNASYFLAVPWWTFWEIKDLNPNYFKLPAQSTKELMIEDGNFVIKDLTD